MRFTTLLVCTGLAFAQTPDELNFLSNHVDGQERTQMLPRYLKAKASRQLAEREQAVASIKTMAQLEARRTLVKEKLVRLIGGLPTKTPLNARTVSTLKRRRPDMSQRHPAIFLNVFAVFSTILSHRAPSGFPANSGSMPQVAWNL